MNLIDEIQTRFSGELLGFLQIAGKLADGRGENLYFVGGIVRDLLLNSPNYDLDLVVEGDAPSLARLLAEAKGGKVVIYSHFGTAKLKWRDLTFDIATARLETYAQPGALPKVSPGTIYKDLQRRDFTINAMAVALNPTHFGNLIDPYNGKKDLEQGIVRVLHSKSFIDDPTRIFRALRYEQRLNFHLEQKTEELLCQDAIFIHEVTGERLRHELELIFEEEHPERVFSRAEKLGVLEKLHPALKGDDWIAESFKIVSNLERNFESEIYFALLAYRLDESENESLIERLKLSGKAAKVMRDTLQLKQVLPMLAQPHLLPSDIYSSLKKYTIEAIQVCALSSDSLLVCERLELYLKKLRHVRTFLTGNDLKKMGISQGKQVGELLHSIRDAKLNGEIESKEEEEKLACKWLMGVRPQL